MDEITAKDVGRFKEQANEDLDSIIERFNKDLTAWEARTQCRANFRWEYANGANKRLAKSEIVLPVYLAEPTEEDVSNALTKLQESLPVTISPA